VGTNYGNCQMDMLKKGPADGIKVLEAEVISNRPGSDRIADILNPSAIRLSAILDFKLIHHAFEIFRQFGKILGTDVNLGTAGGHFIHK
jgi:hypothetical protein